MLEVGTDGVYLVDKILHTHNAKLAEAGFDDRIISERDTLLIDFAIATLVDELANTFKRWIAVCDEGLDDLGESGECPAISV